MTDCLTIFWAHLLCLDYVLRTIFAFSFTRCLAIWVISQYRGVNGPDFIIISCLTCLGARYCWSGNGEPRVKVLSAFSSNAGELVVLQTHLCPCGNRMNIVSVDVRMGSTLRGRDVCTRSRVELTSLPSDLSCPSDPLITNHFET